LTMDATKNGRARIVCQLSAFFVLAG